MDWQRTLITIDRPRPIGPVSAPISAVSRRPHHLDMFFVDAEGRVRTAWFTPADGYGLHEPLSPPGMLGATRIAAVSRHSDQLDIFVADATGRIVSAWWSRFPDNTWRTRTDITDTRTTPGAPITAVARTPHSIDIFFADWYDPADNTWRTRADITDIRTTPGAPITAVARTPHSIDIFFADTTGRIVSAWYDPADNTWRTRTDITTVRTTPGAPVTAVARRPDQLDIFFADATGRIVSAWWNHASNNLWHTRNDITDTRTIPGAPISAVTRAADRLDIAFVDTTGSAISVSWADASPTWMQSSILARRVSPGIPIGLVARGPRRLDAFVPENDGRFTHAWWAAPEPEPAARLRLVTFNTKLMYLPGVASEEAIMARARRIGDLLATGPAHDVVCLQEVFSHRARVDLIARLHDRYPHATPVAGPTRQLSATEKERIVTSAVAQAAFWMPGTVAVAALVEFVLSQVAAGVFSVPQDSGLLVLSRYPLENAKFVSFGDDAEGPDRLADKGVLRVRVKTGPSTSYVVFSTHTQASYDSIAEGVPVRAAQLRTIAQLIEESMIELSRATTDQLHTIVCGDLNIIGDRAFPAEWRSVFETPGAYFTREFVDGWASEMACAGHDAHDEGITNIDAPNKRNSRLDYVLVRNEDSQAPAVVHQMRLVYPGASDHIGVFADINEPSPHHSPARARDVELPLDGDAFDLPGGRLRWYRVQGGGTWSVAPTSDLEYDVFVPEDMSTPRRPVFETETREIEYAHDVLREYGVAHTRVRTYAVPADEFFVCVRRRPDAPGAESSAIVFIRHLGTSPASAIHVHPQRGPVSVDTATIERMLGPAAVPSTLWFASELHRQAQRRVVDWTFEVHNTSDNPVTLTLTHDAFAEPPVTWGRGSHAHVVRSAEGGTVRWRIDRANPAVDPVEVSFRSPLTFVQATMHSPRLICEDETGIDALGADEISLIATIDGAPDRLPLLSETRMHTGEAQIVTAAPLGPWRPSDLGFTDLLRLHIIENEDVGDDTDATAVAPLPPDSPAEDRTITLEPGSGRYTVHLSLGRTPEG
ncbi:MAG: hypothetical protein DI573_10915 [Microbacterium sp.]|uniref:endonuclease/exonuclease/phosphatase family protein n=1 Tax=Microbacterium sp. TaxID=51671 RepID=UPI000DB26FFB|nr:endonuclease/exonuclease/phosphatase family protein [Microbacterium sp.]PZU37834.1 MAG: hypothetical protein DI573_10915 [Microbacterium sp.]